MSELPHRQASPHAVEFYLSAGSSPTTRKVIIMTSFNAPVTAISADLSREAAMGGVRLAPSVLDGTLRSGLTVEATNSARLVGFAAAQAKRQAAYERALAAEIARENSRPTPPAVVESDVMALAEGEELVADLRAEGAIVEVEGDVAEVVAIISDARGEWVRIVPSETGEAFDILLSELVEWVGDAGENEVLSAYDRAEMARMRSELIAA